MSREQRKQRKGTQLVSVVQQKLRHLVVGVYCRLAELRAIVKSTGGRLIMPHDIRKDIHLILRCARVFIKRDDNRTAERMAVDRARNGRDGDWIRTAVAELSARRTAPLDKHVVMRRRPVCTSRRQESRPNRGNVPIV